MKKTQHKNSQRFILITVLNLKQIQSLDLSEYLLIDYLILKDFPFIILHYTKKKTIKMYILEFFSIG